VPEIHQGNTVTSPDSGAGSAADLPDYAPIRRSALGPALNDQGYYVGRVERNLYWITDGVYQSAFLTTGDGVVLFDAPPSIGGNRLGRVKGVLDAVTERAAAPVIAKYTGVLAAADIEVFTTTTTFAIMQSLRLDRGPSGPVHP
jgi:hypothetical protein